MWNMLFENRTLELKNLRLAHATDPASTKLHRVIQKSLLLSLGQTNRHLTRLISQAKLRGAEKEGMELEKAYGGQITAAAVDS